MKKTILGKAVKILKKRSPPHQASNDLEREEVSSSLSFEIRLQTVQDIISIPLTLEEKGRIRELAVK